MAFVKSVSLLLQVSLVLIICGSTFLVAEPAAAEAPQPSSQNPLAASKPSRNLIAVQGVVYCKPCKYAGVDTLNGAAPLVGAVVKLQCNNTKSQLVEQAKTDKNGFFFLMPHKVTTDGSHKCKTYLVSSPLTACNVPSDLHGGATGASLNPTTNPPAATSPDTKKFSYKLFTVGPFAFEPHKNQPCMQLKKM